MSDGSPPPPGTPRVQPFYCPYCGEEDFVPSGAAEGGLHCRSCDRRFSVRFLGIGAAAEDRQAAIRPEKKKPQPWPSGTP